MGSSLVSRRTTWSIGSVLWVIVLSIFSAFQLWRGAWVDGILFTALTLLLIVDASTGGRIHIVNKHVVALRWVTLVIVLGIGVVLAIAPRHGLVDLIAMILIGITALVLAWSPAPARPEHPAAAYRASAITWSVLGVALCVWEAVMFVLSTYLPGGTDVYPTVSVLLDPFLEWPVGKVIFIGLWLFIGLALLRVWSKR